MVARVRKTKQQEQSQNRQSQQEQLKINPVLERIVKEIKLLEDWDILNDKFSKDKVLFPYQVSALENALKALRLYFDIKDGNKSEFAKLYDNHDILSLTLKEEKLLTLAEEFYQVEDGIISFEQICNRMSFWMATGSGKTLVIVKLIDILFDLMEGGLIPEKPVLFLTSRDDLLDTFKKYVKEFNEYHIGKPIIVEPLNEYVNIVRQGNLFRRVFTYRSDLISDEKGDKILDFKKFLTNKGGNITGTGDWYVILDEAHKGDKKDSKRQLLINILAKEGFLFNFSATFTEPIDIATTVYNLNLAEFIKLGYGKQIYVSQSEIKGFERDQQRRDFNQEEKKKIILKTLILLAGLKKAKENLPNFYHNPLVIYLVNSVNKDDSDIKLLFEEILNFAKNIDENLLENVKEELIQELKDSEYTLGDGDLKFMEGILKDVTVEDIYTYVYNSKGAGNIEYVHYPENYKELALKHTAGVKPFALIKLGTTKDIMKGFLSEYSETETYEDQKWFENLNSNDSPFNLLIGSRAFYEGWDSPRPNVIVFINLGQQSDAKKFVLQAIGRGVRVEPIKNERQRLSILSITRSDISGLANTPPSKALETLFVFATNRNAVETVLQQINIVKTIENWHKVEFKKNDQTEGKCLLIPKYKQLGKKIYELEYPPKFTLSKENYELLKMYFDLVSKEKFSLERGCSFSEFEKLKKLIDENGKYFKIDKNFHYRSFERLLSALLSYLRSDVEELDTGNPFIPLPEKSIVHFKEIMVKEDILESFMSAVDDIYNEIYPSTDVNDINLERLSGHYYIPIAYTNNDSAKELVKHIITVESEVEFLKSLKSKMRCLSQKCEYWFFSKLDETTD
ncbi:DEAD/DEAH box helicase family protein, partial [Fervidobacterium gondwanense]|uniref:DEAD/DEAH box helicase family protein n=1 Tax=Fervidobacterium gondwanense TaxID=44754 RepID=UPI003C79327A